MKTIPLVEFRFYGPDVLYARIGNFGMGGDPAAVMAWGRTRLLAMETVQ